MWPVQVDAQLSKLDPEEAVVLAVFGCSQHWEYHEKSKNNTLPKPDALANSNSYNCAEVSRLGGIFCVEGLHTL